ncbi:hypothetical protein [Acetobacter orleanensis]|nr:hypothetical protein [Acetobacter orleanensis]
MIGPLSGGKGRLSAWFEPEAFDWYRRRDTSLIWLFFNDVQD